MTGKSMPNIDQNRVSMVKSTSNRIDNEAKNSARMKEAHYKTTH